MNDDIITSSDMMMHASIFIDMNKKELPDVWKNVVSKIKTSRDDDDEKRIPIGERLAGNTRVIDLKNGVLLIETDHPGWIQYLRIYQKFIITGIKRTIPDLEIKTFAFRIAGSEVNLTDIYKDQVKKEKEKIMKKMEDEEKSVNSVYNEEKKGGSSSLPPELLEKFESMKKSLLTNS